VRAIRFLEPMTASMLGNSRVFPPFGAAGGGPGAVANNYVQRRDGRIEPIGHVGRAELEPGDVFVVETPGGGGFGEL
jgi:5-oxoprolinase (ATP-hydrolysing)